MDKRKDDEEFRRWIEEAEQLTGEWEKTWINGYVSESYPDEMDRGYINSQLPDGRM